jgi:hypothetical protein
MKLVLIAMIAAIVTLLIAIPIISSIAYSAGYANGQVVVNQSSYNQGYAKGNNDGYVHGKSSWYSQGIQAEWDAVRAWWSGKCPVDNSSGTMRFLCTTSPPSGNTLPLP